jgi:hypothetical protein
MVAKQVSIERILDRRASCIKRHVCAWCKQPAIEFRDKWAVEEYRISGLCQACQDKVFKNGKS